jgi:MFS family permease
VGTSLGAVVFPPIFAVLVEFQGSWRGALVILALFSAAILIPAAWLVVRNAPEDIGVAPEPDSAQTSKLAAQFEGRNWTLANVLRERTLWITVAGFLPINLMFAGLQNNIGLLAQDLSIAQQPASYLISMLGGAMIAGKLLFGALSDRVDHRILYWGAASLFGVCFLIMLSQPGYAMLMTACGLAGFGMGANLPLLGAIVASRFGPQAFGRVTGIVYLFVTASALGSYIASALRDASGSYDSTFQIFLIGLMPAAIAMAFLPRVKKSEG